MLHPFEVVAEPVRRRILEVLATGRHPVALLNDVIVMEFGVSRSAVSHHLRTLREAGAVSVIPALAERHYGLEEDFLVRLDDAVGDLFHLWDHRYGFDEPRAPIPPVAPSRTPHAGRGPGPARPAGAEPARRLEPAARAERAASAEPAADPAPLVWLSAQSEPHDVDHVVDPSVHVDRPVDADRPVRLDRPVRADRLAAADRVHRAGRKGRRGLGRGGSTRDGWDGPAT